MKKRKFLISSFAAAGILPIPNAHLAVANENALGGKDPGQDALIKRFAQEHSFQLAQHRSHSSHASHSSHRSGSSGRARTPVYTPPLIRRPKVTPAPAPAPSRNTRSTPPSSVLPQSPAIAPNTFFTPQEDAIKSVVRRVQIGLKRYGYDVGTIDGTVGSKTRAALVKFQTDYSLKVTGTITPEVLDAFKIVAE